jgi:hypothetical protein
MQETKIIRKLFSAKDREKLRDEQITPSNL